MEDAGLRQHNRQSPSFTLIELLVVIAIIAVLAALLLPSLRSAKTVAMKAQCVGQMRQIGMGLSIYAGDNDSHLPRVESRANPSTCQTAPFNYGLSGYGYLVAGNYLGSHLILYCPDVTLVSGWGPADIASWERIRRDCKNNLPQYCATTPLPTDDRVDYGLGWWDGAPTLSQFVSGNGFGRAAGGRRTIYWTSDDYACFAYYYVKISHEYGRYMNMGRYDGSVQTILNWQNAQPKSGNYGYYYPYNDRPGWGFWRYFGTGLGMP